MPRSMLPPPAAPPLKHQVRGCLIGRVVAPLLDPPNRAWLDEACARVDGSFAWPARNIADHLNAAMTSIGRPDLVVDRQTVQRHRSAECACERIAAAR